MMRPAVFRHAPPLAVHIREARLCDLDAVNHIIERAVLRWPLAERVKRLSLTCLRYRQADMVHDSMWVAEDTQGTIVGVAVWIDSNVDTDLANGLIVLLHGLYVDPAHQRRGVGAQLLHAVQAVAQRAGAVGIWVKAQASAGDYFLSSGWRAASKPITGRDYPYQYWLSLSDDTMDETSFPECGRG